MESGPPQNQNRAGILVLNIGALINRIGLWCIWYYTYNKEPATKNSIGKYLGIYTNSIMQSRLALNSKT